MFQRLDVFEIASSMAVHAGHRQALVAENVAHADTPGYHARDLPAFSEIYESRYSTSSLRATRPEHLFGSSNSELPDPKKMNGIAVENGNSVTIEEQMMTAVDVKRQHDRAVAIYRSALSVLRSSIGRQT